MSRPDSDWTQTIVPEVPPCEPWGIHLQAAAREDLEAAWGVESSPGPGGHLWARPDALLGPEEHPGITEEGPYLRVTVEDFCLRCGTVRTVLVQTDGVSIEYEVGAYALTAADVLSELAQQGQSAETRQVPT